MYGLDTPYPKTLNGVSISVNKGTLHVLWGLGSGKTTLINILSTIDEGYFRKIINLWSEYSWVVG